MSVKLSAKQKRAVEALLAGQNQQEAALAASVTPRTVNRWLQEPAFAAELRERSEDAVHSAARRLAGSLELAVDVMRAVMLDEDTPSAVRLRAADYLVGHTLKLLELSDVLRRLDELEARLAK